jgi:hypothetical protein
MWLKRKATSRKPGDKDTQEMGTLSLLVANAIDAISAPNIELRATTRTRFIPLRLTAPQHSAYGPILINLASMRTPFLKATLAVVAALALAIPGQAAVTRLVVEHTETLGKDGYQKLTGRVYGELDPKLPLNAIITDLELAPRNARGLVEYSATFTIIKPADMSKASGVLLYFVPNRGRIDMTSGGFIADARKRGDVLVASGWQADLEPAAGMETLSAPVAKNLDGSSITGPVLARFSDMPADSRTLPILRGGVPGTADPNSFDTAQATLTRRSAEDGAVIPIVSTDWAFGDCSKTPFPGTPDQIGRASCRERV